MDSKFKLGDELEDIVSGLKGVCIGICFYATGCTKYLIRSAGIQATGEINKNNWIDKIFLKRIQVDIFCLNFPHINKFKFNFYDTLKDTVSNFVGKCVGISVYPTGCIHYSLQAEGFNNEGLTKSWQDFNEIDLVRLEANSNKKINYQYSGGPVDAPPRY